MKRDTKDLEVTCKVCNAKHYLELKYGKLPYQIIYNHIPIEKTPSTVRYVKKD